MRILLPLTLALLVSSCGIIGGAASLLGGGSKGPTVNANVQAGAENNQSVIDQSSDISGENVTVDKSSGAFSVGGAVAVSYTHLTLPTKRIV